MYNLTISKYGIIFALEEPSMVYFMKKILSSIAIIVLASVANVKNAHAGVNNYPQAGKILYGLEFAYELDFDSEFLKSSSVTNAVEFGDAFDNPYTFKFGVSQGLSNNSEVYGNVAYSMAGGKTTKIGGGVNAAFGDYTALEFSGGYRQYFDLNNFFRPYISAEAGLKYVDKISANISGPGISSSGDIYDTSYIPTLGLGVGAIITSGSNYRLALESGFKYEYKLSENDSSSLVSSGLGSINGGGERIFIPLSVRFDMEL